MSRSLNPEWYHSGDVPATIRDAVHTSSVSTQTIVDVLMREELDAPRDRVHRLVKSARDRVTAADDGPTHDLDDPRPNPSRFVDSDDVSYLGTSDFATVLGVALSRYEGAFRTPETVDGVAVDMYWNRQYTTVGFRTIPRSLDAPVEREDIEPLVNGETTPTTGRSPSTLGVVTSAGFTSFARDYADEHDIRLFDPGHLTRWFKDARLTHDVLGTLLEGGDLSEDELTELVDTLPPVPDAVRGADPLRELSDGFWSGTDDGRTIETDVDRPIPVADPQPSPGEKGTLYADPTDDGDYDALGRFMTELQEDEQ